MDKRGNGWNCVVGRNFGGHVIHQTKKYIFFQVRELSVLLWKAWFLWIHLWYKAYGILDIENGYGRCVIVYLDGIGKFDWGLNNRSFLFWGCCLFLGFLGCFVLGFLSGLFLLVYCFFISLLFGNLGFLSFLDLSNSLFS